MALQTLIELVDDLHGGPADETVPFALDGKHLVIDLDAANAARLRDTLAEYIAKARRIHGKRPNRAKTAAKVTTTKRVPRPQFSGTPKRTTLRPAAADVRAWAESQRIPVNPRGRIPDDVVNRYLAASQSRRR